MSDRSTTGNRRAPAADDAFDAGDVDIHDPHKAEKLAKAGRDDSPKEASE